MAHARLGEREQRAAQVGGLGGLAAPEPRVALVAAVGGVAVLGHPQGAGEPVRPEERAPFGHLAGERPDRVAQVDVRDANFRGGGAGVAKTLASQDLEASQPIPPSATRAAGARRLIAS